MEKSISVIKSTSNSTSTLRDNISYLKEQIVEKDQVIQAMTKETCNASSNATTFHVKSDEGNVEQERFINIRSHRNANNKRIVKNNTEGDYSVTISNRFDIISDHEDCNGDERSEGTQKVFMEVGKKIQTKKRSINILGDSILKDIKVQKMNSKLPANEKIYVKCFPGADVNDMKDYVKPTVKRNSELVILHCGTNDLKTEKKTEGNC